MSEADILNTIIAEAGGDGRSGMTAVAYTIANRAAKRGLSPTSVVKEPGQYAGYSNPGSGSRASQQNPRVRAEAKAVWDAVQSRSVPDPTNGGTDFRSGTAARSLGSNVVKVGGNTFKLGNAPTTAVAAINAAAPDAAPNLPDLSAYANPAFANVSAPPLPIPRPSNHEGIRSVEINPDGTLKQSLTDALAARYSSVAPSADAASSYGNILPRSTPFVSEDHPRSDAVSNPVRTSGMVPSIIGASDILPGLGGWSINVRNPDGTFRAQSTNIEDRTDGASLAPSHEAYIPERIQQQILAERNARDLPPFVSDSHPLSNAVAPPLPRPRPDPMYGNPMAPKGTNQTILAPPGYGLEQPNSGLVSRPVHTVQIDPLTGNPVTTPSLQDALNAKAAQMAQQRPAPVPQVVGRSSPITAPAPSAPPPRVTLGSTPGYESYPETSGAFRTPSQAGNVALPPNVVPSSVLRDLQAIVPRSMNSSGSPDDRQMAPVITPASLPPISAPVPMPGRPSALNVPSIVQRNSNDVVKSVPYTAPQQNQNYTNASNVVDIGPLGLTTDPFRAKPAVQAIQQAAPTYTTKTIQVLNPQWSANPVAINKLQDIHDLRDDATMAAQASAQPKYITQTVRVPVPHVPVPSSTLRPLSSFNTVNPLSQIVPNIQSGFRSTPIGHIGSLLAGEPIQGGLLGMLFGGGNPLASIFGSPSQPQAPAQQQQSQPVSPAQLPGSNFLADRGISPGLTSGQQMNSLMAALSGNRSGSV